MIAVIEAMKTECEVASPAAGIVTRGLCARAPGHLGRRASNRAGGRCSGDGDVRATRVAAATSQAVNDRKTRCLRRARRAGSRRRLRDGAAGRLDHPSSTRARCWRRRRRSTQRSRPASALPLAGVPFAVKDNIDVAGLPTTAACPAFAYRAEQTAPVVQRLLDAGAVLIGKTNLDQFATGLAGSRTPYGALGSATTATTSAAAPAPDRPWPSPRASSPSRLASDTAGSGRVPAALNGLVGLKPTRGRWSTRGLVPACRSLDCVSVLANSAADAALVDAGRRRVRRRRPLCTARAGGAGRRACSVHLCAASPRTTRLAGRSRVPSPVRSGACATDDDGRSRRRGRYRPSARGGSAALPRSVGRGAHRRGRGALARRSRRPSILSCAASWPAGFQSPQWTPSAASMRCAAINARPRRYGRPPTCSSCRPRPRPIAWPRYWPNRWLSMPTSGATPTS